MLRIHRLLIVGVLVSAASASAQAAFWGTTVTDAADLTGANSMRSSASGGGITAAAGTAWANGGFALDWNVYFDNSLDMWVYQYYTTVAAKGVSHLLLEVTDDDEDFVYDTGLSSPVDGLPQTYGTGDPSNPNQPNALYGVKFNFGGDGTIAYTLVTDRGPVWGVFYTKDGKDGGIDVTAWANALSLSDYKTNASLTETDFIVRPDGAGTDTPEPASIALMVIGGLMILKRRAAV